MKKDYKELDDMKNELFKEMTNKLSDKPKQLTDFNEWLFVIVNTAKSIIDNTNKERLNEISVFAECSCVSQMQSEFDKIQGIFGRDGFSQRYSPTYLYLCSLVAFFPEQVLSSADKELIKEYIEISDYLLYSI